MQEKFLLKGMKVKYKVMSVNRLPDLQKDIDKLKQKRKISENKIFRNHINPLKFIIPESVPKAKYLISLALETKLTYINFHYNNSMFDVMIPPNYCDYGVTTEEIEKFILNEIIKKPGYKVENTENIHLKHLASRSGLGRYGRNNIIYVDELGSLVELYCFFTDYDFGVDNWEEAEMLERCEKCSVCINKCPTQAISRENFIINVDRCLSLYNEMPGEIPNWIDADVHNAIIDCMKCQMFCPANKLAMKNPRRFLDITEEETKAIFDGNNNETLVKSICEKLTIFKPEKADYYMPIIKRNLEFLLK
ncbi:MAG TPA: 4Fe-4S double cluster binding domain-containing protein [candidate division Zixibacteria bacterium]|nr:4Fe-4S double cluster binding domain-containing protein [candidate division Zixibacteria bacterium]